MHRRIGLSAAIGVQHMGNQCHPETSGQYAAATLSQTTTLIIKAHFLSQNIISYVLNADNGRLADAIHRA